MRKINSSGHVVDILFVLGLFLLFAISALFLVLFGATIYKSTTERMNRGYEDRTAFAYVTEKIRQADRSGSISVSEFDGTGALVITENYDGVDYYNYIYMQDGFIKELFTCETSMKGIAGEEIIPVRDFHIEPAGDRLYRITITGTESETCDFYVSVRTD